MKHIFPDRFGTGGPLSILLLFFLPVQSVPAQSGLLEEVIVTAQKREQSIQDVGISSRQLAGNRWKPWELPTASR